MLEKSIATPLFLRGGVFSSQAVKHIHPAKATLQVLLVQCANAFEMQQEWNSDNGREHRALILISLKYLAGRLTGWGSMASMEKWRVQNCEKKLGQAQFYRIPISLWICWFGGHCMCNRQYSTAKQVFS